MELLLSVWLGLPVWIWAGFVLAVLAVLAFDLGVLHRTPHVMGVRESLFLSAFYIALGLLWAVVVWWIYHEYSGIESIDPLVAAQPSATARAWTAVELYLTGYLVEKALAMDNVFVISLIFAHFAIPPLYQHRVLFWGVLGVIVLRALMIGAGAALVLNFAWVLYVFAALLVLTGIRMLMTIEDTPDIGKSRVLAFLRRYLRVTDQLHGHRFVVRQTNADGRVLWFATPLLLCLVLVELADIVFAIDSVPAIFAITPDPFIVYTSNILAILGLRALYFALAAVIHRFHYLKYSLALILIAVGGKVFVGDLFFDGKVPASASLVLTIALLAGGVLYSLWKPRPISPAGAQSAELH